MKKAKDDNYAIKIRSLQAASLYRCNNDYRFIIKKKDKDFEYREPYLDIGKATISDSLFSRYVRSHGVTVSKNNKSLDLLLMKFDWGVETDDPNDIEKPSMTVDDLRRYYYENGATVTWRTFDKDTGQPIEGKDIMVTYKMLLRSPGKAKNGHCIFIKEGLYKKIINHITMGLWEKMKNKNDARIVEISAYSTLITATAIDFIKIPLKNIFVLEDEKVSVVKKAMVVRTKEVEHKTYGYDYPAFEGYINEHGLTFYKEKAKEDPSLIYIKRTKAALEEHGIDIGSCPKKEKITMRKACCCEENDEQEITNTLWDGMGLIDSSIFPQDMEGFIYCRSYFFKSCLFRCEIQRYLKDYYGNDYDTVSITDMTGRKINVRDIKVIITENSLKFMKFLDLMSESGTMQDGWRYYDRFMKKNDEMFAIVKTAHHSKYGDLQRTSFQMVNTLLTTDREILQKISQPSIDYCNKLKTDDEAFLHYLDVTGSEKYSINNVLINLYELNDQFKYTNYFKKKRTVKINELKQRMMLGKLFQHGDNLTICGNPIAMLMKLTEEDPLNESCFTSYDDRIQCYTTKFPEGTLIAGFRSPHNAPNNIVYLENVYPDAIKKYLPDLGDGVIIINGIQTDIQSRLNGQDLDSDSIFATDQEDIVGLARKAYIEHPTIVNAIQSEVKAGYNMDMVSFADMDSNIALSQYAIGKASNDAQLALSRWFNRGCKDKELQEIFIICSVLAQVAIDSSKKAFEIDVSKELSWIEKRLKTIADDGTGKKYPCFYAKVQGLNDRKKKGKKLEIKKEDVILHNCPMDITYDIIDKEVIDLRKHKEMNTKTVDLSCVFRCDADKVRVDRKQYKKIIRVIEGGMSEKTCPSDIEKEERLERFNVCADKLKNLTIKKDTMYMLIDYAFRTGNEKIRDDFLVMLYDKDKKTFLNCFQRSEKSPQRSAEKSIK